MDENWHAICQAIFKGIEGVRKDVLQVYQIHKAVNIRHPSTSRKGKTLWNMREAKANGEAY